MTSKPEESFLRKESTTVEQNVLAIKSSAYGSSPLSNASRAAS